MNSLSELILFLRILYTYPEYPADCPIAIWNPLGEEASIWKQLVLAGSDACWSQRTFCSDWPGPILQGLLEVLADEIGVNHFYKSIHSKNQ